MVCDSNKQHKICHSEPIVRNIIRKRLKTKHNAKQNEIGIHIMQMNDSKLCTDLINRCVTGKQYMKTGQQYKKPANNILGIDLIK